MNRVGSLSYIGIVSVWGLCSHCVRTRRVLEEKKGIGML